MSPLFRNVLVAFLIVVVARTASARGDDLSTPSMQPAPSLDTLQRQLPDLTKRENFSAAMQILILLTVLSLAPAILLMMTSFTRIIIVMSLLRQALGTTSTPPNQVLVGLALFLTLFVMSPVLDKAYNEG